MSRRNEVENSSKEVLRNLVPHPINNSFSDIQGSQEGQEPSHSHGEDQQSDGAEVRDLNVTPPSVHEPGV